METTTVRRLGAEFLGTGMLVAAVVGSGIMASRLTDDVAVELLVNALATVAALGVLIWTLGPISGAHFNPAVTLVAAFRRELNPSEAGGYVGAQIAGALGGVALANVMFGLDLVSVSGHDRSGAGLWTGEAVATLGLVLVIFGCARAGRTDAIAWAVSGWIVAAYWFTSSTSFANPAVTIGRTLSDTFAGISPASVPMFVLVQLAGGAIALGLLRVLHPSPSPLETVRD